VTDLLSVLRDRSTVGVTRCGLRRRRVFQRQRNWLLLLYIIGLSFKKRLKILYRYLCLAAHRRQIQATRTTTDANMLTVTAVMRRRPRMLDHSSCAASTSDAAPAALDPAMSVSERSVGELQRSLEPERSLADLGRSGTCQGPSGWSSDLDIATSNQSAPISLSCVQKTMGLH